MSHSFNKKYFNIILSITRWITKVGVVALFILMGLLLLAAGVVMFLPIELFDFNLGDLANINIQYLNAFISVNPDLFSGIVNVKWLIVSGGLIGLLNLGFLQYIFIMLKKVIIDVSDDKPFSTENIVRINKIGYSFVIVAIIFPIFNGLLMTEFFNLLSLNNMGANYMFNFQQLFIGFLIIVLANVFDYGSYLQEDHDMTV